MTFFEAFKKQLFMALTFISAFIIVRIVTAGFSSLNVIAAYNPWVMLAIFIAYMATGIYLRMRYNF